MSIKANPLLLASALWLALYVVLVGSVYLLISNDLPRAWSIIPGFLLYLLPAYVLAKLGDYKWFYSGLGVGLVGSLVWLLHSQLLFMGIFPYTHIISHLLLAIGGAYLGHKAKLRKPSNNSFKLAPSGRDVPNRHAP